MSTTFPNVFSNLIFNVRLFGGFTCIMSGKWQFIVVIHQKKRLIILILRTISLTINYLLNKSVSTLPITSGFKEPAKAPAYQVSPNLLESSSRAISRISIPTKTSST